MAEKENKTLTLSDKKPGTLTLSDKKSGTLTLSDKKSGTLTLSDKKSGTLTLSDKKSGTLSLSDKKSGTLTLSDKKSGTLSLSDKKRDAKTIQQNLSGKTTKNVTVEHKYRTPTASAEAPKTGDHKLTEKEKDNRLSAIQRAPSRPVASAEKEKGTRRSAAQRPASRLSAKTSDPKSVPPESPRLVSSQEETADIAPTTIDIPPQGPIADISPSTADILPQGATLDIPPAISDIPTADIPDPTLDIPSSESPLESANLVAAQEIKEPEAPPSFPPEEEPKKKGVKLKPEKKKPKPPVLLGDGDSYAKTKKVSFKSSHFLSPEEDLLELEQDREEVQGPRRRRKKTAADESRTVIRDVVLPDRITVQELANRMARRVGDVIKELMKIGVMATINQEIDADTAEIIINDFGHRVRRVDNLEQGLEGPEDREEELHPRAPVVTVMGHVDHGKTSLLDRLRQTNTTAKEAGGITQHIGAYQVRTSPQAVFERITVIDTPGHEIFTQMRTRGATMTDIVVLVIAADDGIMPQTVEAIHHVRAAKVPLIVAINKIDLPSANPGKIREDLLRHEIVVETMGGEVLEVEVSAKNGHGLDALIEAIILQAEMLNLRSNPNRAASGLVIESRLDRGKGALVSVLVQRGTLKTGDFVVAGQTWGKVRVLTTDQGEQCQEAPPSTPVEISGMNAVALAGESFFVVEKESKARQIAQARLHKQRSQPRPKPSQDIFNQQKITKIPVILKADTHGSLEAMSYAISDLNAKVEEVAISVLHGAVGAIHETDIAFAQTSGALILGFNVRTHPQALDIAKRDNVPIHSYTVIYHFIESIKMMLEKNLQPTIQERVLGSAKINKIFVNNMIGQIAGCLVVQGNIRRGSGIKLFRDHAMIHQGRIKSLRRFKDEVKEVREGYECGIVLDNYQAIQVDDIIEAFDLEEVARTL